MDCFQKDLMYEWQWLKVRMRLQVSQNILEHNVQVSWDNVSRTQSGITYVSEISLRFTAHSRLRQRGSKNKSRKGSDTFLNMAFQTRGPFAHSWYLKIRHLQISRSLWRRNGKGHHQTKTKQKKAVWSRSKTGLRKNWSSLTSSDTGRRSDLPPNRWTQFSPSLTGWIRNHTTSWWVFPCGPRSYVHLHSAINTYKPRARHEIHQNIETTQPSRWQYVAYIDQSHDRWWRKLKVLSYKWVRSQVGNVTTHMFSRITGVL